MDSLANRRALSYLSALYAPARCNDRDDRTTVATDSGSWHITWRQRSTPFAREDPHVGRRVPPLYRRLSLHVARRRPLTPEDALQPNERTALLVAAAACFTGLVVWAVLTAIS